MGFTDFLNDAGLSTLNSWLATRSYVAGHTPTQADVTTFKALKASPDAAKYPHAYRWYKHVASHDAEFASLPGDPSKPLSTYGPEASAAAVNPAAAPAAEEEEEEDLFGSDSEEEDPETVAKREANLAAYKEKKALKTKPAAKTMVTLDVKPWDDETDMKSLEENLRKIDLDGLVWGGSKLVAVGFGIKKLQINATVEDDKVSIDDLQEQIAADEDNVQSTDVAAMQKL